MYQVFAYVVDGGDGSNSIFWFDKIIDEEELYKYQEKHSWAVDSFIDGDGLEPKTILTFQSHDEAERCGINVTTLEEYFE